MTISADRLRARGAQVVSQLAELGDLPDLAVDDLSDVGCCADGTAVSLDVVRRLACDAGIVVMVEGVEGAPVSVGRKTRAIPGSMKRALLQRDRGCRFPGCSNRLFVEGHHVEHWADGGETRLTNLVSCAVIIIGSSTSTDIGSSFALARSRSVTRGAGSSSQRPGRTRMVAGGRGSGNGMIPSRSTSARSPASGMVSD